jgi:uncharacterized protein
MLNKSVHPQEIIVWSIIPFLRREIAFELKNQGLDQRKISSLLNITESAVSQYVNEKRANQKIKITKKLKDELARSAKSILNKKSTAFFEIQRLINHPEVRLLVCSMHKKEFGASNKCTLCEIGLK